MASTLSEPVAAMLRFGDEGTSAALPSLPIDEALSAARDALLTEKNPQDVAPLDWCRHVATLAGSWLGSWHGTPPTASCHELPHGDAVISVFAAAARGHLYEATLLSVAVLERVLSELIAVACASDGGARLPSGGLLKDMIALLQTGRRDLLGGGAADVLATLFSPTSLNLRNLVWHGFLTPDELDRRYAAILLLILLHAADALALARRQPAASAAAAPLPPPPCLWLPETADDSLSEAREWLDGAPVLLHPPPSGECPVCLLSPFCPPAFRSTLQRALASYCKPAGGRARFAVLVLPIIEAGLRHAFVRSNPSEHALGRAHLGEYFSTLDGYGQRSRHQLLLDYSLHSNGGANQLCAALGQGMHELLLDLFMHAAGPSLRARYAHGEAALCATDELLARQAAARLAPQAAGSARRQPDAAMTSDAAAPAAAAAADNVAPPLALHLLYAALLSLCAAAHDDASTARLQEVAGGAERLEITLAASARLHAYRSLCAPSTRLAKRSASVQAAIAAALADGGWYSVNYPSMASDIDVRVPPQVAGGSPRTLVVACEMRASDDKAAMRIRTLGEAVTAALDKILQTESGGGMAGGAGGGDIASAGDMGGDSAAMVECSRWGVLECCERFCLLERARLAELTRRVATHAASTSQRRTFVIACLATLPLRRLVALVLALAANQPLRASTPTGPKSDATVPLPRLHALAEALCAAVESGKGVDHAITLASQFLAMASVQRALF